MPIQGLTPRTAQQRIERLALGDTTRAKEQEIVDILGSLNVQDRGEALRLIDGGGDHHTVNHLVNDDIDDPALRRQASKLIDEARPFMSSAGLFVVSDIDDTVRPSQDRSVDKSTGRYPGARALFKALDDGKDGKDADGDVHFVTARDGIFVHARETIEKTGIDYNSIRYGKTLPSFFSLVGVLKGIEDEKVRDVEEMLKRNPSRKVVLVGDTVQADAKVYRRVQDAHPDRIGWILIHEVNGKKCPADLAARPNVIAFTTYADAARQLHARGAISDAQLQAVIADV